VLISKIFGKNKNLVFSGTEPYFKKIEKLDFFLKAKIYRVEFREVAHFPLLILS
jgi:hypothetical protein